jgi:hypothetical protein
MTPRIHLGPWLHSGRLDHYALLWPLCVLLVLFVALSTIDWQSEPRFVTPHFKKLPAQRKRAKCAPRAYCYRYKFKLMSYLSFPTRSPRTKSAAIARPRCRKKNCALSSHVRARRRTRCLRGAILARYPQQRLQATRLARRSQ